MALLICTSSFALVYATVIVLLKDSADHSRYCSLDVVRAALFTLITIALTVLLSASLGLCNISVLLSLHLTVACCVFGFKGIKISWIVIDHHLRYIVSSLFHTLADLVKKPALLLIVISCSIQLVWCGLASVLIAPHVWDELAYHIPICGGIVQTGSMSPIKLAYPLNDFYLGTTHLLYGWVAVIGRNTHLISGMHWLLLILAGIASYATLRLLNVKSHLAIALTSMIVVCPIYIIQSLTAYVDLSVVCWFSMAILFLYTWQKSKSKIDGFAFACSLALLQGAKIHSPLFVAILLLATVIIFRRDLKWLLLKQHIFVLIICLMAGSFWMFSKAVRFDNPFYPLQVKVGQTVLLEGKQHADSSELTWRKRTPLETSLLKTEANPFIKKAIHLVFSWLELGRVDNSRIHTVTGGFGKLFAILIIPCAIAGMLRNVRIYPEFPVLFVIVMFIPLSDVARYTPILPFLLILPAGLWLSSSSRSWWLPVSILILASLIVIPFPGLCGYYGDLIKHGLVKEIFEKTPGPGTVVFGFSLLVAVLSKLCRSKFWQTALFLPCLWVSILSANRYPIPSTLATLSGLEGRAALTAACKIHRLTNVPYKLKHIDMVFKIHEDHEGKYTVVYSGYPYPPVTGLLFNRSMSNSVKWINNSDNEFRINCSE